MRGKEGSVNKTVYLLIKVEEKEVDSSRKAPCKLYRVYIYPPELKGLEHETF